MKLSNSQRVVLLACAALLACGCTGTANSKRNLTILHISDLHARFLPDDQGRGGFAYVAAAIKKEKAAAGQALMLNGGDLVQGTPVSSIYEGIPCYEVANSLGIDVATLGNHEFDYGWQKIHEFIRIAAYPVVAANVVNDKGELLVPKPYVIREVGGLRVAIIGALTAYLPQLTREATRGPWKALPVVEPVRRYAAELQGQSDLIVVLGHLAHDEDESILREVPEVALVVSGHEHSGQKEVKEIDHRLAVKVRAYGVELGRLDLTVDVAKKQIVQYQWRRIPIDTRSYQPDSTVVKQVEEWESKVAATVDIPIGTARRAFSQQEVKTMLEQAMATAVRAELAYANLGGVRDRLPKGQILARHAWNIMPFDNVIVYGRIKGKQIPQEGVEGRNIEPEREYTFATNDFVADQWKSTGLQFEKQGPLVRDALIDWIKKRKVLE